MTEYVPKHASDNAPRDTLETRTERMSTIMSLTVDQLRDMLLTLALREPATFDAVRFSAL